MDNSKNSVGFVISARARHAESRSHECILSGAFRADSVCGATCWIRDSEQGPVVETIGLRIKTEPP